MEARDGRTRRDKQRGVKRSVHQHYFISRTTKSTEARPKIGNVSASSSNRLTNYEKLQTLNSIGSLLGIN